MEGQGIHAVNPAVFAALLVVLTGALLLGLWSGKGTPPFFSALAWAVSRLNLPDFSVQRNNLQDVQVPTAVGGRSILPDVLRGFALLGILLINAQDFAGFQVWTQTGLDRAVQVITDIFFNGRAISLFALLFGWGAAALYWKHGWRLYLRRQSVLFAVGLLHFVLLWHGDIIATYAQAALLLPLWLKGSARRLALLGVLFGLVYLLFSLFGALAMDWGAPRYGFSPRFSSGESYFSIVAGRWHELPHTVLLFYPLKLGELFSGLLFACFFWMYFLLGAALRRSELLLQPERHLGPLRRMAFWGLGLGWPLGALLAWVNTQDAAPYAILGEILRTVGGLPTALGYIGLFGLWTVRGKLGGWRVLSFSGRMAMTNYIVQSAVMSTIFYPYTFGLYGKVGAALAVAVALTVGILQVVWSHRYLSLHSAGPLEIWVRRLVYWR